MSLVSQKIAQDFSHAAQHYDAFAGLQRAVVDELLLWVPQNARILDAGAGTGYAMQPGWLALDIAQGMCRQVPGSLCADMQALPIQDGAFDGVLSSLAMQWLEDPSLFLREAHRVTREDGTLVLGTLGQGTLQELRQSFTQAGMFVPLLPFQSTDHLAQQLEQSGWRVEEIMIETKSTSHRNLRDLLHHLKGLGARYKSNAPQKGLRGKSWLQQLAQHYPHEADGSVRASWEIVKVRAVKG